MLALARSLLLALIVLSVAAWPANASQPYVVVLEPGVSVDREANKLQRSAAFKTRLRYRHALQGFAARLDAAQVWELRADPQVAAVVPDRTVQARAVVPLATGEPVPPTGGRRIGAMSRSFVREAASTAVAVLDTGVDLDHPDLNVADGTDCITPGTTADDDDGHGTHVAGIIGAKNNGTGTVGIAPGTRLISVKVLDDAGNGEWSEIICGVDWVTGHAEALDIRVANMSLGGATDQATSCEGVDPLHLAVCRMTEAGVLAVSAAGNNSVDFGKTNDAPSSFPEVLAVTGMSDTDGLPGQTGRSACGQSDDRPITNSSYASRVTELAHVLAAPGSCIRSTTRGGGTGTKTGTSMSTAHVSAAAALCIGEGDVDGPCAALTPAEILTRLMSVARARTLLGNYGFIGDPVTPSSTGRKYGYLVFVEGGPPPDPTPEPTVEPTIEPTVEPSPDPTVDPGAGGGTGGAGGNQGGGNAGGGAGTQISGPGGVFSPLVLGLRVPRQGAARVLRRGLIAYVRCPELCSLIAGIRAGAKVSGSVEAVAFVGERVQVVIPLSPWVRRSVLRGRAVLVQVSATGASGAQVVLERRVRLH